jgi:hypothetical protein
VLLPHLASVVVEAVADCGAGVVLDARLLAGAGVCPRAVNITTVGDHTGRSDFSHHAPIIPPRTLTSSGSDAHRSLEA